MLDPNGSPVFSLKLRQDDKTVVRAIHTALDAGHVYPVSEHRRRQLGFKGHDCVELKVRGIKDCLKVIKVLDGHMRSKKSQDFTVWSNAVKRSAALNGGKRCKERKELMMPYREKLQKVKQYANPI